jgi:transposase InsO family protein
VRGLRSLRGSVSALSVSRGAALVSLAPPASDDPTAVSVPPAPPPEPAASSRYGLSPESAPARLDGRRPRPRRGGRRLSVMQLLCEKVILVVPRPRSSRALLHSAFRAFSPGEKRPAPAASCRELPRSTADTCSI